MADLPPSSPWWNDDDVMFHDHKYNVTTARKTKLTEKIQIIGVFFGFFRNRSTKHFIKYLNKLYTHTRAEGILFEVIYIPQDEDEADCEYFVRALFGDWLTVPWANQQLRRRVKNMYNVVEQPALVIVKNDEKGSVVTVDGKGDLLDYGYFSCNEWFAIAEGIVILPPTPPEEEEDEEEEEEDNEEEESDEDEEEAGGGQEDKKPIKPQ